MSLFLKESISELSKEALLAAHDIQSPVTALRATLTCNAPFDERKKKLAMASLQRIQEITAGLLSKYHNLVDANKSEEFACDFIEQIVQEKKISLPPQILIHSDLCHHVKVSSHQAKLLRRVVSNLLNNSIEAIFKKSCAGNITILLKREGLYNFISVKDDGCGIEKSFLTKLGQWGLSYKKETGHGFALAKTKRLMQQWDGKMLIDSVEQQYTEVRLFFK